jgi:ribonuclease HI
MFSIYTDGACSGNPGPGGWAAVVVQDQKVAHLIQGFVAQTTNNRMELTAAIEALKWLIPRSANVYTDSSYVQQGITIWLPKWQNNGWQTANRKPVKNQDLWQTLAALITQCNVQWHWVKGHADCRYNIQADSMARAAVCSS